MSKKNNEKIRVATYIRVSTTSEAQKTSKDNQPKYFSRLLEREDIKQKYKLEKTYIDRESGTKLTRKHFDKMLEDAGLRFQTIENEDIPDYKNPKHMIKQIDYVFSAKATAEPKFDEIWVKSTSRFARNTKAIDIIVALLRKGINVYFLDYDLNSNNDNDLVKIKSLLDSAEDYSRGLSRNVSAAKQLIREQGIVNSNKKLFGYTYHVRSKDRPPYYEINENEAKIVRKIFETYAYGDGETNIEYGARRLSKYLAEQGMFNRNGKKFAESTLKNMLDNEKYMGMHNPGKHTTGSVFNKYTTNYIREDYKKYLIETEDVPRIVEPELWYKCQEVKKERYEENPNSKTNSSKKMIGKNVSQNKYAKYLRCKYCNGNFRFDNNKGNPFYTCSTKEKDGVSACNVNNVSLKQLEELIEILKNGEYKELFKLDVETKLMTLISIIEKHLINLKNPSVVEDIEGITNVIEEQTQEIKEIYRQLRRPNAIVDVLEEDLKDLEEKLTQNKSKLDRLSTTPDNLITKIREIFSNCYNVIDVYNSLQDTCTEEEILDKLERVEVSGVRPESRKYAYKAGLLPIFKESYSLNKLINFNTPTFTYKIKELIGEDELLDEPFLTEEDLKYNTFKETLDNNLKGDAFNLETGYIKNLGIVGSPSVLEQIITKLDSLRLDAEEIINKYTNNKTKI